MIERGIDMAVVQKILRHQQIQTTQIYAKINASVHLWAVAHDQFGENGAEARV